MNCPEKQYFFWTHPPHPGGPEVGGVGVKISKVREIPRTGEKIDNKKLGVNISKVLEMS